MQATDHETIDQTRIGWSAVYATAFCAAVLVGTEFLPVSLLTPIAADFGIPEGQAGRAVAVSGVFAVLTSLSIARLSAQIDRRLVLVGLMSTLLVSSLVVAMSDSFTMLMAGRALLGVAVGGFWSFSAAVTMRLLLPRDVPKGLALIGSAVAVSSTIAGPMATNLGEWIGWRGTFLALVPVSATALIWLWISLPALPTTERAISSGSLRLLARPQVLLATIATMLAFTGQFVVFTYVRPLLETVSAFSASAMSGVFLAMGLAGVIGAWCGGYALRRSLFRPLIILPAFMGIVALGMVFLASHQLSVLALFILWGFMAAAAPIGWGLWLSRVLPDEAEVGGGLQVAAIQTAIALGALIGGYVLDRSGWQASIAVGAAVLFAASLAAAGTALHYTRKTD